MKWDKDHGGSEILRWTSGFTVKLLVGVGSSNPVSRRVEVSTFNVCIDVVKKHEDTLLVFPQSIESSESNQNEKC
jgi:hypothetical protein